MNKDFKDYPNLRVTFDVPDTHTDMMTILMGKKMLQEHDLPERKMILEYLMKWSDTQP